MAHAPSGTSKTKEQDRCFLFCQKASIARKQAQLSCQNYTWGRVGIKPLGAQRTAKTTSAALVAPPQEDIGSKVANVWSFVFPGVPSCTAAFPVGMKTTSCVLFNMWPVCSRSWDHVMIHHLCAWELRLLLGHLGFHGGQVAIEQHQ